MIKTVELTESQVWIVVKALQVLTSDEQTNKLWMEFPRLDFEALSEDIDGITSQIFAGQGHGDSEEVFIN